MEWIGCTVCEIFAFEPKCDLEIGVWGHSWSLKVAPLDRPMIRSAILIQYTHLTDRRTDGIGVAYTRYSMYAVARKKTFVCLTSHCRLRYINPAIVTQRLLRLDLVRKSRLTSDHLLLFRTHAGVGLPDRHRNTGHCRVASGIGQGLTGFDQRSADLGN